MKKYIKIMRIDHWIKQLFIFPGFIAALFIMDKTVDTNIIIKFILALLGISMIASANYVINEYLDKDFDKYHPVKKSRVLVDLTIKKRAIIIIWLLLACIGFGIGYFINISFMAMQLFLLLMGIVYNVKPLRTKDVPILDVITESINNVIRLLLGWLVVSENTIPPSSLILGYWLIGAFLMNTKRYAEYRMISDRNRAKLYRKSFGFYTEKSLMLISFFYAMSSIFFIGIFLIKYKIELLLLVPFLIGLFCYYFYLSFKNDSVVQKPEKLYKEKWLIIYCLFIIGLFVVLFLIDIPALDIFTKNDIIRLW